MRLAAALLLSLAVRAGAAPGFYCGCQLFIDDARTDSDLARAEELGAGTLLRSWYRFGMPSADKDYTAREGFARKLGEGGIGLGGGVSLAVVNGGDLRQPDFQLSWLARDERNEALAQGERRFGSLTSPGFRAYLIARALEQARLGARELHLGEPGFLRFDDWTLSAFSGYLRRRHPKRDAAWWRGRYGAVGEAVAAKTPIEPKMIASLDEKQRRRFDAAWGTDAWKGCDDKGRPAFLSRVYRDNLERFLEELRLALGKEGLDGVHIDLWGFAPWMKGLKVDAFLTSPPDERFGLAWNEDAAFPLGRNKERLRAQMAREVAWAAPVPVIYLFDHPRPFQTGFVKLPDARQAELTRFFAELSSEVGAGFAFRGYTMPGETEALGPLTRAYIAAECRRRKELKRCPGPR